MNPENKKRSTLKKIFISKYFESKVFWLLPVAVWTLIVLFSLYLNNSNLKHHYYKMVMERSQAMFSFIEMTRLWNARHGGVYVPITKDIQPNQYLDVPNRDVVTVTGMKLTKVNPAYMTRQIAEIAEDQRKILFHITSLNPIRPANKADDWETMALKGFENGNREVLELVGVGKNMVFRYMAPLEVKNACMKCHAEQGYQIGDIRGGISITTPAASILEYLKTQRNHLITLHLMIFLIVTTLVLIFTNYIRLQWLELKKTKDEQELLIDLRTAELRETNKQLTNEIKEKEKTEQELRTSETKFRSVTQSANDAIISADQEGAIIAWNKGSQDIFGYSEAEVLGKPLTFLMPEKFRTRHSEGIKRFHAAGESKVIGKTIEFEGLHKSGSLIPVELSLSTWSSKETIYFTAIIRDITERKQMEEEKNKMQLKLLSSAKMATLGEIATGIAHEINQPLTYISSCIQGFKDDIKNNTLKIEELESEVDLSYQQVCRIDKIIKHLRSFGRADDVIMAPICIETVIDNAILLLKERLRLRSINLIKKIDPYLSPVVGNANQMEQVFINLIQNATDAFVEKKDAKITIEIPKNQDKVEMIIKVSDNGSGIEQKDIEKIFEPFFTTKEVGKGTGLGLSIVYGIVRKHNGAITCESKRGEGTTFTITLPTIVK